MGRGSLRTRRANRSLRLSVKLQKMISALICSLMALSPQFLVISRCNVDITPPERLPLGGYTARGGKLMDQGGDPLFARCVLLRSGGWQLALVSAEMLTIPGSLAREVEKRIPKDVQLFLCATHTHCAPDSQMLNDRMTFSIPGIASFRRRWLMWYADKIASAVKGAQAIPGTPFGIRVDEFRLALNRGRRVGAEPDTLATVVEGERVRDHLTTPILAEYAAHAVFHGPERNRTSGDWPSSVSQKLEGVPVLMGAIGDVSPQAHGATPEQRIARFTSSFCEALKATEHRSASSGWSGGLPLYLVRQAIQLNARKVHPDFIKNYRVPEPLANMLVKKFAPDSASITAFRIGSLAVVGVPGEPTSHLGRRIKESGIALGFHSVLVVSHVNGWIGYILDAGDYGRGGYEATLSFYGPGEGDEVVVAAVTALKKLRALGERASLPHTRSAR
jgi:neutral ceramidase